MLLQVDVPPTPLGGTMYERHGTVADVSGATSTDRNAAVQLLTCSLSSPLSITRSTRGSTRRRNCSLRAICVVVRSTPCTSRTRSIMDCRWSLVWATTRAVQVTWPRDQMDLEHLGDLAQVLGHVLELALGDLEADEGQHLVAHRSQVQVKPADGAPL